MVRPVRIYKARERGRPTRYCSCCGNGNQWQLDLKLKHKLEAGPAGITIRLETVPTRKILKALEHNLSDLIEASLNRDRGLFRCAHCGNRRIDFHERLLAACVSSGCPGCLHCGNWILESELVDICTDCLNDHAWSITEEYCDSGGCPASDFGLGEVREHYGITLSELKARLGLS